MVLAGLLGYQAVFMINGVSYLVSALLESFIALPAMAARVRGDKLLVIIKEGFGFIAENRTVRIILPVIGVVHIFYGSLAVAMPFLAKTLAGSGMQNLGYLETAMGAGMILGAVITGRQKMRNLHGRQLFIIILAAGFCFVLPNRPVIPPNQLRFDNLVYSTI